MNTTPIEERVEQAWAGFPLSKRNLSCSTNEIAMFFFFAFVEKFSIGTNGEVVNKMFFSDFIL